MSAPQLQQSAASGGPAIPVGIAPPLPSECAAVWPSKSRIPTSPTRPHPALWLMGAHGGAGVSTLEALIGPAGDSQRAWPSHPEQSPYVLLVAAETASGLGQALVLLRQYRCGMAGPGNRFLGVATVATVPGRRPAGIRQARDLLEPLAGRLWEVGFQPTYRELLPGDLPTWTPATPAPERRRRVNPRTDVPAEVAQMASELVFAIRAAHQNDQQERH